MPATDEVEYIPPTQGIGPCQGARCNNKTQRYGPATAERHSGPLCNVCEAKLKAASQR
ncbi:hypothetical protein [Streptomyces sp. NPDC127038]|uniref:hypothetical protein n=1 Tax=Streptomyces sp. NPDC127038 TaxID=3347114 RepID=UPI0036495A99